MARPLKPEPKFFLKDELFEKGLEYYEKHFFSNLKESLLRGEKTTTYIESNKAAKRISYSFPEAKIVFILRNPVDRAVSNYWFSFNNGLETLTIEEAFKKESELREDYDKDKISTSPFAYLKRGLYIDYIEMYERYFSRDQIKILIFENFVNSEKSVQDLYSFLNINNTFKPSKLNKIINKGNKRIPDLNGELKSYLYKYFRNSNRKLEINYNIDLSVWKRDY